ncbi:hypothetical protein MASR2M79_12750 [Aminivibrio sp.]
MAKTAKQKQLPLEQLRKKTDPRSLGFETTEDIPALEEFIGQKRAVSAISFGLEVESKGYNIFVLGNPGSGRTTYSLERLRTAAKTPRSRRLGIRLQLRRPGAASGHQSSRRKRKGNGERFR